MTSTPRPRAITPAQGTPSAPANTDDQSAGMAGTRTGGCQCGWIRFSVSGKAVYPHTCSCRHCQRLGGAPLMWWAGWPAESVTWTGEGEPQWFETFEGRAKRGFCPRCGSRLAAIDIDVPELGINVPALDDTSGADLVPVNQSFKDNAVHWLSPLPDATRTRVG